MSQELLVDLLESNAEHSESATVELSNELVPLLSEQLYRSPIKAIEELVVNSYDAKARICKLFVPDSSEQASEEGRHFVVVFDDGDGMTAKALVDLWHVGRSPKQGDRIYKDRKQIGKFGIGKIATFAIANRLTYVTKTSSGILMSSLDFRLLVSDDPNDETKLRRVPVSINSMTDWKAVTESEEFAKVLDAAGVSEADMEGPSWTLAILEDLKDAATELRLGRLRWVLRTAMPLKTDFVLSLNNDELSSAKSDYEPVVSFPVEDLKPRYIEALNEEYKSNWSIDDGILRSKSFPSGVTGEVQVFEKSLFGTKSDDLERSHGFFVRVRDRLVNLEDPLFGTTDLTHKYFSRFCADVNADDLDKAVKAAREGVEVSTQRREFVSLLRALFNDARNRYNDWTKEQEDDTQERLEDNREYVSRELVERPLADVLAPVGSLSAGADADQSWFYLRLDEGTDIGQLIERLYTQPRHGYEFNRVSGGKTSHFVSFDPSHNVFTFNDNHEFVRKHSSESAGHCLEDLAIAEVLLEVYLHEEGMPAAQIGEILQRRDALLRSLARDSIQSPEAIAAFLRDSASEEVDLEIAMVAAARALGFVAKHIAIPDKPDGVARLTDIPEADRIITLEAKSGKPKSHEEISFSTLREHTDETPGAKGCLLVAPSYKGQVLDQDKNAIANQSRSQRISCWTVEQLARVVEATERRHISADRIYEIVTTTFAPVDVETAIEELFKATPWDQSALIQGIIDALRELEPRMTTARRSVDMITTQLANDPDFDTIQPTDVEEGLRVLASASQGALSLGGEKKDKVQLHASLDELENRVSALTKNGAPPIRKPGTFRKKPEG